MSHWNYRATKDKDGYAIREVFYDKMGREDGWTEPICGYFETLSELHKALHLMLSDAENRPIMYLDGHRKHKVARGGAYSDKNLSYKRDYSTPPL